MPVAEDPSFRQDRVSIARFAQVHTIKANVVILEVINGTGR